MPDDKQIPRTRVVHPEGGDLMTKQSMAAETDVNHIMKRWIHHGIPPLGSNRTPRYGDFSSGIDFQAALNSVQEAIDQFDRLPSHIRLHCHNDPAEFLALVYNAERRAELEKLGLVPEQVPEAAKPIPAPDPQVEP